MRTKIPYHFGSSSSVLFYPPSLTKRAPGCLGLCLGPVCAGSPAMIAVPWFVLRPGLCPMLSWTSSKEEKTTKPSLLALRT